MWIRGGLKKKKTFTGRMERKKRTHFYKEILYAFGLTRQSNTNNKLNITLSDGTMMASQPQPREARNRFGVENDNDDGYLSRCSRQEAHQRHGEGEGEDKLTIDRWELEFGV